MIVDSSAIVAILLKEPGHERLRDRLAAAEQVSIGAPTVLESSLVLSSRLGHAGKTLLARIWIARSDPGTIVQLVGLGLIREG